MSDVTAKVHGKNGTVLFEGLVADAEKFIENHFPRMHSVEAGPDFTVVTDPANHPVALPDGYEPIGNPAEAENVETTPDTNTEEGNANANT